MGKLQIGVLVPLKEEPKEELDKVAELGLNACQICCWKPELYTAEVGERLKTASEELQIRLATLWAGWPGPATWNFVEGPSTIGLVPPETRRMRVDVLKKAAEFAAEYQFPSITTHLGFIPEDPSRQLFTETVDAVREVALHCKSFGIGFWFETGQETPVTLLRTIETAGTDNLGINLDPANLIMYGKGNPVDAMDVFGSYVKGVHAKDGLYPTEGTHLGKEVPLGQGKVNFPVLIPRLKEFRFDGVLAIEREISGRQQIADIKKAIALLSPLC
jgi:sugar phosphate isomerase/epimerase